MRPHIEFQHLPPWLHLECFCELCGCVFDSPEERHQHTRDHHQGQRDEEALAVRWMLGVRDLIEALAQTLETSVERLPDWVRQHHLGADPTVAFGAATAALLRDVALFVGLPIPTENRMDPSAPRHPVDCLHWRVLTNILARLDPLSRSRIRSLPLPQNNGGIPIRVPRPPAVDAHCHLTTLISRGVTNYCTGPFKQTGIVDNRVFPGEWTKPPVQDPQCITSYGVHPNNTNRYTQADWQRVLPLMEAGASVGECGMDEVRGPQEQADQERLFRDHIRVAVTRQKSLTLHLRGDATTFHRTLRLLSQERVPTHHPIYIHCYTSDMQTYENWIRMYPNSIFGVSTRTIVTEESQLFCKVADLNRLVLESDAPYLGRART